MSIFPFIDPVSAVAQTNSATAEELPLYKEYAYDYERNCLKIINGSTYLVEGNAALKIWIYKVLRTVRYRYIAHTPAYGSETSSLIGVTMSQDVLQAELRRYITEALMVNPYITEVGSFKFVPQGDIMQISFVCQTIYGEITEQFNYNQGGAGYSV